MSAAGILFTDGQKLLLLRRAGKCSHTGKWCMPGGKAKEDETPLETAERECKEEIGSVKGSKFAKSDEDDFTAFLYKIDKPFGIKLSSEHDKHQWVSLEKVEEFLLHPEFKKHLPYYLKAIKQKFSSNFSEFVHKIR